MNRANLSARHRILLLSVWCEDDRDISGTTRAGGPVVRFSLEDPRTGRRRGFQDQDALVMGLERMLLNEDECAEASIQCEDCPQQPWQGWPGQSCNT
jgi:hypothetical protein